MPCSSSGSEWADKEMEAARVDYREKSDEKEKSQWLCIIGLFLIGESKEAYGMGKTKVKMIQKSGGKSMERSSRKSI